MKQSNNLSNLKFEGQYIVQIRLNRYCIDLVFSNDVIIQICSELSYYDKQGNLLSYWNDNNSMNFFMNQLLEIPIVLTQVDSNTIKFVFSNYECLILKSNNDEHESFTIFSNDGVQDIFKQFELQIKQHDINNPDILRKYWWKER